MNRILQLSINSSIQLHRLALKSNVFLRNPSILCGQTRIYGSDKLPIKEEDTYVPVYKYPSIKYMSAISSSKKFHFMAAAVSTPLAAILQYIEVLEHPTAFITAYFGELLLCKYHREIPTAWSQWGLLNNQFGYVLRSNEV